MKKSNDLLIGVFTIILLIVLYWGISFLKGENLFSSKRFFYASYENVDGLTISRPVTINGFRVGQVSSIDFNQHNASLIVQIAIEEDVVFSTNSVLEIYDSDIMGSKSLELKMIPGDINAVTGDTLLGTIATGLTSEVTEQFGSMKVGLDQLIISFDKVLKEVKDLSSTANRLLLSNENQISRSIENIEQISNVVELRSKNIDNLILNLSNISDSISAIDFVSFSKNVMSISSELNSLLLNIQKSEGSLSKIVYEDSIYNQLKYLLRDMDDLIIDIKENPKKYINISVFGNDKNSKK